mmetsp:Transcript_25254/g.28004  ORF Transcript_25254/g.28004 Transcript_25254/m.28004 type:complete len:233 (+) Transcript_25254:369-1067(+)
MGVCIYTAINSAAGFALVYAFHCAKYGNLNLGILTSLFGLSSIFSAIMAYFIFGDKLKMYHIIGMIMMLLCILGLVIGSTKNLNLPCSTTEANSRLLHALIAIILATMCPILSTGGGLTVRYFNWYHDFNPLDMTISMYFLNNLTLMLPLILTYTYGTHPFILYQYLEIVLSGFIAAIGIMFMNKAVTLGLAGPVFAISNIQVILQTSLDATINGVIPSLIEIIAASLGVLG